MLVPLIAIILGTFMVILDSTVVNVALPTLGRALHTDLALLQWVITAYMLAQAAVIPLSGWLSDRFGRVPVIAAGALLLFAAVILAGFVPGDRAALVITGLFLNGIGWNMAFVSGSALLTDALSASERASTQGLADLMLGLSGALGSAAGGMILGAWGFVMLNVFGAFCVVGPLLAAWLAVNAAARRTV